MAPIFGQPNYDFLDSEEDLSAENERTDNIDSGDITLTHLALYYTIFLVSLFLVWLLVYFLLRIIGLRQKTRDPQRRMYVGSRARPSLGQQPPTIFVSPANLPPPPKYEAMAPPSYEEVVGVHYPTFQPPISQARAVQPITQPITEAVAQSSNASTNDVARSTNTVQPSNVVYAPTTMTIVSEERRPSVDHVNNR